MHKQSDCEYLEMRQWKLQGIEMHRRFMQRVLAHRALIYFQHVMEERCSAVTHIGRKCIKRSRNDGADTTEGHGWHGDFVYFAGSAFSFSILAHQYGFSRLLMCCYGQYPLHLEAIFSFTSFVHGSLVGISAIPPIRVPYFDSAFNVSDDRISNAWCITCVRRFYARRKHDLFLIETFIFMGFDGLQPYLEACLSRAPHMRNPSNDLLHFCRIYLDI